MSEGSEQPRGTADSLTGGGRVDPATEAFVAHRNLLFAVADEMLGSVADVEDVLRRDGEIDSVMAMRVEAGLITGLYAVRNPGKLSRIQQETLLSR